MTDIRQKELIKEKEVIKFSDPSKVLKNVNKYFRDEGYIFGYSLRKDKKYQIYDPNKNKWIHFGQIGYRDYTLTKNKKKRDAYLKRATNIKGDWKDNKYSANNLAINLLWN
jgi:hypothetical protein